MCSFSSLDQCLFKKHLLKVILFGKEFHTSEQKLSWVPPMLAHVKPRSILVFLLNSVFLKGVRDNFTANVLAIE